MTIPASVTSIGDNVFADCSALLKIHVKANSYAAEFYKDDPRLVVD